MDRRDFLTGAVTTAIALSGAVASSRADAHDEHAHEAAAGGAAAQSDPRLAKIVETSLDCVKTGDACIRHCVELLGGGNTALKECLQTALDMTAVCRSMAQLASQATAQTKTLRAYVAACAQYCRDCAAACKKHAEHHAACKACLESCNRCVEACESLAMAT